MGVSVIGVISCISCSRRSISIIVLVEIVFFMQNLPFQCVFLDSLFFLFYRVSREAKKIFDCIDLINWKKQNIM